MILVSACLAGVDCRYDGTSSLNEKVMRLIAEGKAIPVCPEQLGGCTTPRPASEIYKGTGKDVLEGNSKVITRDGEDVTEKFIRGAQETLKIARIAGCKKAILKSRSPSCGCCTIYDGTFSNNLIEGKGITAELLQQNGIDVVSEEEQ